MQSTLKHLREFVDVLSSTSVPSTGKKIRGGKTERLKAVSSLLDALQKKSTLSALSAASRFEMVRGPPDNDDEPPPFLTWAELATIMLDTLCTVFEDAANAKTVSKSGNASVKPEFFRCFRLILRSAIQYGPPGVIRSIVPPLLVYSHDWLSNPPLRALLADDIWQVVRDILHDDSNRAMLTPPLIRLWVDVCFEQLTGFGALRHRSDIVSRLAGEVLQLIATGVDSFDTLTQSTRGVSPSKMIGGDFGYAIVCEHCCMLLLVADTMSKREARELQLVAFRTLTIALTDHAFDISGSVALQSIIHVVLQPLILCWMERKCHESAVALAHILTCLAPSEKKLLDDLRRRILADVNDSNSSALVRAGQDVKDTYILTAAACFSFREALEFAASANARTGHIIIWLRVAHTIMSRRTLKKGVSVFIDAIDVFDQCSKGAEAMTELVRLQGKSRGMHFADVVHWACEVINVVCFTANKIYIANLAPESISTEVWHNLYHVLRELVMTMSYDSRARAAGYSRVSEPSNSERSLLRSVSLLCGLNLLDSSTLEISGKNEAGSRFDVPYPISKIVSADKLPSYLEVEYFRNLIARIGLPQDDGASSRIRLIDNLVGFCASPNSLVKSSVSFLMDASSAVAAIARGECRLKPEPTVLFQPGECKDDEDVLLSLCALRSSQEFLALSAGRKRIPGSGPKLVRMLRDQDSLNCVFFGKNRVSGALPGNTASFFDSTLNLDSNPNLTRRSAVNPALAEDFEQQIYLKLRSFFDEILGKSGNDAGPTRRDRLSTVLRGRGFKDVVSGERALKGVLFGGNYLLETFQMSLSSSMGGSTQDYPSRLKIAELVTEVLTCLSQSKAEVIIHLFEFLCPCLRICLQMARLLICRTETETENSAWKSSANSLSDVFEKLASGLSSYLFDSVFLETKKNLKEVEIYSEGCLREEDADHSETLRGIKRRRRRPEEGTKRQRTDLPSHSHRSLFSPGSEHDPDQDPNDDLRMPEEVDAVGSGSDHDSGSEDLNFMDDANHLPETPQKSVDSGCASIHFQMTCERLVPILQMMATELPLTTAVIYEQCEKGMARLKDAERFTSPDGFERPASFSPTVSPTYLAARSSLWNLLLNLRIFKADVLAGTDILKYGKYWKDLEKKSQAYVSFHINSFDVGKRKQYPVPSQLESARIVFLEHAQKFLQSIFSELSFDPLECRPLSSQIYRIIVGVMDVADYFRVQHAFRMPRATRIAFLKFGYTSLSTVAKVRSDNSVGQMFQENQMISMMELAKPLQGALFKSLAESDASVRLLTSRLVPRLFARHEHSEDVNEEQTLMDSLSSIDSCQDSGSRVSVQSTQNPPDAGLDFSRWSISVELEKQFKTLHASFRKIGSRSKGLTVLVTLGELCASRDDLVPFCFSELFPRLQESWFLSPMYIILARVCLIRGISSPAKMFREFSRVIYCKLFDKEPSAEFLYNLPVALISDNDHHRDGVLVDWLREEESSLLPHLLVRETSSSLDQSAKFADIIGVDLSTILKRNVGSFSLVYPMHFPTAFHDRGRLLWQAIDDSLDGKSFEFMRSKKDEVLTSLLQSTSCNQFCQVHDITTCPDVENSLGFQRDTSSLHPPLYDPLIIALTLNQLYSSSSSVFSFSSDALRGSLFADVRDAQTNAPIADNFVSFLKECRRQNTTLLRSLLSVAKALDPSVTMPVPQTQQDAFFCVGMLWRMIDVSLLMKSTNERLAFYRLVSFGFLNAHIANDAAWLLDDVQKKLITLSEEHPNFQVNTSDLHVLPEESGHLTYLQTSLERQMYELLTTVSPVLVSVVVNPKGAKATELKKISASSLTRMVRLCSKYNMWSVLLANGPFPSGKDLKEVSLFYEQSVIAMDGAPAGRSESSILSCFTRFRGLYPLRSNLHSASGILGCLQELQSILSDSNVTMLSNMLRSEAWVRNSGSPEASVQLISSTLSSLLDILQRVQNSGSDEGQLYRLIPSETVHSVNSDQGNLMQLIEDETAHTIANVISALGLIHPRSIPFIHTAGHHHRVPPLMMKGMYEDVSSGVRNALFLLLEMLRSSSSVVGEAALNTIVALLQVDEAKTILREEIGYLEAIRLLRVNDRASGNQSFAQEKQFLDPRSGDVWYLRSLPSFLDADAWTWAAGSTSSTEIEEGMCTLATVFAADCSSSALKTLAPACFASYRFSCDMLPYILFDIVCTLGPDELKALSALIREFIITRSSTPASVLRIFVRTLDVLCQSGLKELHTRGITSFVSSKTATETIPCLYKLDIPYSDAIAAALRSGSHFSVLRFCQLYVDQKMMQCEVKLWSKKKQGNPSDRRQSTCPLRDPTVADVDQSAREYVKPWMLEALSQINDVDGVRAFCHGGNSYESSANIAMLDKQWIDSFRAMTVAARYQSPAQVMGASSQQLSNARKERMGVDLEHELGILQAFLGLGSVNAVIQHWDGLMSQVMKDGLCTMQSTTKKQSVIDRLNELRFAAAWKLERWESPQLLSTDLSGGRVAPTNGCGIQEAVFKVIHSLRKGRLSEIPYTLAHARSVVLKDLCQDSTGVSSERLFDAASKLRVLHVLDQGKNLLKVPSSVVEGQSTTGYANISIQNQDIAGTRPSSARIFTSGHSLGVDGLVTRQAGRFSHEKLNIDQLLGSVFGIGDLDVEGIVPSRDAFLANHIMEDLPLVLLRNIEQNTRVVQAAVTTSARILALPDSGSLARAAACLASARSNLEDVADPIDTIAWRLQDARLQWSSYDDARLKKQALSAVKMIISDDLHGYAEERNAGSNNDSLSFNQTLTWDSHDGESSKLAILRTEACCLAAEWSLDMRTHEPMDLFQMYLKPALKAARAPNGGRGVVGRAYFAMASFADAQLSNIDTYRKSRKFVDMVRSVNEAEENLERLRDMKEKRVSKAKPARRRSRAPSDAGSGTGNDKLGKDLDYLINTEAKKVRLDKAKVVKLNESFQMWQAIACESFAASLRNGTPHDLRAAFRMVAIWLDAGSMREKITESLLKVKASPHDQCIDVPLTKLLPLSSQLFSRLNYSENVPNAYFQRTLASTMTEMAGMHPAHCLWQLLALTNATRVSGNDEKMSSLYKGDKDKKEAADSILQKLESSHGRTVSQMKKVADAYINLSEMKSSDKKEKVIDIRRSQLLGLGELRDVPVPTVSLPLLGTSSEQLPHIQRFDRKANVCAGLSKPLKITCIGSDGRSYAQVVKGRDDLRGDAVMQQMFTILNNLLERDTDASKRSLHIRTYRIVPLSPFSGIMQFVVNTKQVKEVLTEADQGKDRNSLRSKGSLHERYRPKDLKHDAIWRRAAEEHLKFAKTPAKRLRFLTFVWQKFQPVFRHFFTEQWPDPAEWYTRQLNYSRSMAVMSFVGFILGIGDRHLSNILFDVHTSEVVHIDFGVAFESGKMLPTPEHMPFRLTRDLVDGFGIAGVEGAFRKCSEITLSVMRRHKDVLLTVLEVLLHDPMFNWDLTPEEILREQMEGEGLSDSDNQSRSDGEGAVEDIARRVEKEVSGSRDAQRALNRISEKLDGLEGTERLSVEAHVARLVDEAQAFHVIALVFPGWGPWL